MRVTGADAAVIERAAQATGVKLVGSGSRPWPYRVGAAWSFVLRADGSGSYMRKGYSRRKDGERRATAAICWHGHKAFMVALFAEAPGAVLRSHMATYRGAADFARAHWDTGDKQVGSMVDPIRFSELCDCEEA